MPTPSLIATAGCWRARWAPAAVLTLLGCAGCSGDGVPAPSSSPWAPHAAVHRALTDAVTLGAVIIDRVQFEGPAVEPVQQDRVATQATWVELVNPGNEAVRMAGFGLSDQTAQPFRWVFPADAVLVAGGRLRVALPTVWEAAATLRLTAPNGTATGVLLDSTESLRPSVQGAWCRRSGSEGGARFGPCGAAAAVRPDDPGQALAGLAAPTGALRSRE